MIRGMLEALSVEGVKGRPLNPKDAKIIAVRQWLTLLP